MFKPFKFSLRTPNADLFETEGVVSLTFASEGLGTMQVLPGHESITATLTFTPLLVVKEDGSEDTFLVRNGLFLFDHATDSATMLALHAEAKKEMNMQTVKEYMAFIEDQLAQGKSLSDFQVTYLKGEKIAVEEQIKMLDEQSF